MKFCLIDAGERTVKVADAKTPQEAYVMVGLKPLEIDHGTIFRDTNGCGVCIVVYEYGLMAPPNEMHFFSVGRQLYAGNAVLYAFDEHGETIDLSEPPPVMFYRSCHEAEQAIRRGEIIRPQTAVNGEVMWEWRG